jgi:hypothetical protein
MDPKDIRTGSNPKDLRERQLHSVEGRPCLPPLERHHREAIERPPADGRAAYLLGRLHRQTEEGRWHVDKPTQSKTLQ